MNNLKKLIRGGVLALSLMVVAVPTAYAQTDATAPAVVDTTVDTPAVVETDDGFDWGWLGLLGLLGLAGLGGRNRREVVDRDRSVNR